jgi:(p)ppGpp synthase/HD superfamily hydrolase
MGKVIEKKDDFLPKALFSNFKPNTLEAALAIASFLHQGVKDKGGNPYIQHPMWVAMQLMMKGEGHDVVVAGILHDTIEDTPITEWELRNWFTPVICDAVVALSFQVKDHETETRQEYMRRVAMNPIARKVKLMDLTHNMDIKRLKNRHQLTEKDLARIKIYAEEYDFLVGGAIGV